MKYQNKFFIDNVNFKKEDPCIWIVYPSGAAGDLLASIVNFHYAQTGCYYFGITELGRVIFKPSDDRLVDIKYIDRRSKLNLTQQFVNDVNEIIGKKNLNYSMMDQVIFSNHAYEDQQVETIINFFANAKIIRILPKNNHEENIIHWLKMYKHFQQIMSLEKPKKLTPITFEFEHPNLLNIQFADLLNQEKFEDVYSKIIKHLDLQYKLIRFDLVEHWIDQQHESIKPSLRTINN